MGNHYFSKYQHYSHQDLYNRVVKAQPHTATASAQYWFRVQNELYDLSQAITNDVATVAPNWQGDGGAEFQQRMSVVSKYSEDLSNDAASIGVGLAELEAPMTTAVKNAHSDNPANTGGHENAIKLALGGAVTLNPVAAVGGGLLGMVLDDEAAQQAQQRMVHTISNLAAQYDTVTQAKWPENIAAPPPGLPGGPAGPVKPASPGTTTGQPVHAAPDPHGPVSPPMIPQPPAPPAPNHPGGHLDPMMLAAAGTTGVGLVGAVAAGARPPSVAGEEPPAKGGLTATFAGTKGAPSVLGREGTEPAAARTGTPTEETARRAPIDPETSRPVGPVEEEQGTTRARPGMSTLDEGRPAAGRARVPGQPGEPDQEAALTRGSGTLGTEPEGEGAHSGYLGGRGLTGTDEEEDERLTWLTEDEMVWGQNRAAPGILGNDKQ